MKLFQPYNRLYHYRSFEIASKYILPERKLLLNHIINTNDPRENKSFIFSALYRGDESHDIEQRNREVSEFIRKDCKVLCFSDDNIDHFWGYSYSRMWALYGGNHTGICLGIDKNEFIIENQNIIDKGCLKKVDYDKDKMVKFPDYKVVDYVEMNRVGKDIYLKNIFRKEHLDYLFFTKNKEWESEEEIRLLYFSDNIEQEFCSIRKSLKKIYVGVDCSTSTIESLIKLCPDIDIHQLEFKGHTMQALLVHEGLG